MPLVAFLKNISGIIDNVLVPLVFAIAFIVFIWGVFQYFIAGAGNEEKRNEGKQFVLYGIIGFFLMLSIWGIVNMLTGTFGFDSKARPDLPSFNGSGNSSGGAQQIGTGGGTDKGVFGSGSAALCDVGTDQGCSSNEMCVGDGTGGSRCIARTNSSVQTDNGTPTPATVSNPATGLDGPPPIDTGP